MGERHWLDLSLGGNFSSSWDVMPDWECRPRWTNLTTAQASHPEIQLNADKLTPSQHIKLSVPFQKNEIMLWQLKRFKMISLDTDSLIYFVFVMRNFKYTERLAKLWRIGPLRWATVNSLVYLSWAHYTGHGKLCAFVISITHFAFSMTRPNPRVLHARCCCFHVLLLNWSAKCTLPHASILTVFTLSC